MHHPRPHCHGLQQILLPLMLVVFAISSPDLAMAQASPFMTGATSLQTNLLAWFDAGRHHPRDGSRRHGDGKSHVLGVVPRRNSRHRNRLRSAANRDLGTRDVRRLGEKGGRTQPRSDGGSPLRGRNSASMQLRGVTYSALLFNMMFGHCSSLEHLRTKRGPNNRRKLRKHLDFALRGQ